MFYDFSVSIPANTLKSAPVRQELKLTHGVITSVRLDFRQGTDHLVNLVIKQGLHQVYPTNAEGSFHLEGVYCSFEDWYELFEEPFTLTAEGWSDGTTYPHTVDVQIGLIESDIALALLKVAKALSSFLKLVGITL